MVPPVCLKKPHVHTLHGDDREDPFFWLKEKSDPAVLSYLEEENAYTSKVYEETGMRELTDTCYKEFLARLQETDSSPPYRDRSEERRVGKEC